MRVNVNVNKLPQLGLALLEDIFIDINFFEKLIVTQDMILLSAADIQLKEANPPGTGDFQRMKNSQHQASV